MSKFGEARRHYPEILHPLYPTNSESSALISICHTSINESNKGSGTSSDLFEIIPLSAASPNGTQQPILALARAPEILPG